jgi:hypothetical protein
MKLSTRPVLVDTVGSAASGATARPLKWASPPR